MVVWTAPISALLRLIGIGTDKNSERANVHFMNCLKRLQRFLAGFVVVTFFVTNTLAPAPIAHASTEVFGRGSQISNFTIPAEFGRRGAALPVAAERVDADRQADVRQSGHRLAPGYPVHGRRRRLGKSHRFRAGRSKSITLSDRPHHGKRGTAGQRFE